MTSKEIGTSGHSSIGASGHAQVLKTSASIRGMGGRDSQRVSLFGRARQSFVRSGGERGATLSNLRGTTGADFEAKGDVERTNPNSAGGCGCLGGGSRIDTDVIILIKGPFCFIFKNEAASTPRYAINLAHMKAKTQSAPSGRHPVALETNLGDIEYEVYLKDEETAELFQTTVSQQAADGETDEVRKRLGHGHLLNKRASIRFAESVATKKIEDQPEAPVSTEEIFANMNVPGAM
mmetsp:Transcript_17807/g.29444  ORF Transcript_17807/g.29444 Transcript_17807/m.29444 type:complete len:236 (-) Transcript_17807:1126-1833(-)